MKKVLLGLVVTAMMTGSGYADLTYEECKYLINEAEKSVIRGHNNSLAVDREADRLALEGNNNYSSIDPILKNELDALQKAHYYTSIYSVLCD